MYEYLEQKFLAMMNLNIFDRIFSKDAKTHDIECNILTYTKVISSCP